MLYPRCAGLNVHKKTVVAALRIVEGRPVRAEVRRFATTTTALLAVLLRPWRKTLSNPDAALIELTPL